MDKLKLQFDEGINVDTLTGRTVQKSVYIESGARRIYIGINTLVEICDYLRSQGIRITPDV